MLPFTQLKGIEKPKITNLPTIVSDGEVGGEQPTNQVSVFFSKLFEARQMAHIFHLQAQGEGSGWKHAALNTFYDEVLSLTDELIETYQGQYGIVEGYETINPSEAQKMEALDYIKDFANFIKSNRMQIPSEDTHLHNIVDEIVALVYKTIYKLTYLK